jgi:CRISPR/Cas system endoribonuclease Cas6 (RAMP superfamily)
MALEVEKGRTEEEIGLFNTLIDYAFFCGTGMYTDAGLGQTRRLPGKGRI